MSDTPLPLHRHASWVVVAVGVVYALLLGGSLLGQPVGLLDEPLLYLGARSVLEGGWPHLDFMSIYPPLYYVPTAWGFALFGQTALAGRLTQMAAHGLLLAALLWAFYGAGLRSARLAIALLAALAVSAALPLDPAILGITPSLLALVLYLQALEQRDGRWRRWAMLAAAGLCLGLALLTRLNFGLYALAALSIDQLMSPSREVRTPAGLQRWLTRDVAPLWLAVLLVLLAVALSYAGHVREVWSQSTTNAISPAHGFAFVRSIDAPLSPGVVGVGAHGWWLPILPLVWLGLRARGTRERLGYWSVALGCIAIEWLVAWAKPEMLPLLVSPGLLASTWLALLGRPLPRREQLGLLATSLYSHYYLSQPDGPHQLASAVPALLLLPSLLDGHDPLPRDRPTLLAIVAFFVALAYPSVYASRPRLTQLGTAIALLREGGGSMGDAEQATNLGSLAVPLAALYPDPDERSVARFIRERSRADEPVMVTVADPDGPAIHNLRLSWLLGRPLGSRHLLPISEVGNTAAARASVISDLETRRVAWAVEWHPARAGAEDGLTSTLTRRDRAVQELIAESYEVVLTQGDFVVRHRPRVNGPLE
jgi:hypothetical protein